MYKKSAPINKNGGPGDPPKKGLKQSKKTIDIPNTNDSLAVYMQNDYNRMYKKGEIDKPIGNWSDIAAKAEERYPGLSETVGDEFPKGLVTGATISNAKKAREKYNLSPNKMTGKAKAELDDMPIVDDEKNGAYVSGPFNMNAYQDKKASMDDYSHEKKLGADGRYDLEHGHKS